MGARLLSQRRAAAHAVEQVDVTSMAVTIIITATTIMMMTTTTHSAPPGTPRALLPSRVVLEA
eukprot:10802488-Ditylum_brightwellii.AAC.1